MLHRRATLSLWQTSLCKSPTNEIVENLKPNYAKKTKRALCSIGTPAQQVAEIPKLKRMSDAKECATPGHRASVSSHQSRMPGCTSCKRSTTSTPRGDADDAGENHLVACHMPHWRPKHEARDTQPRCIRSGLASCVRLTSVEAVHKPATRVCIIGWCAKQTSTMPSASQVASPPSRGAGSRPRRRSRGASHLGSGRDQEADRGGLADQPPWKG